MTENHLDVAMRHLALRSDEDAGNVHLWQRNPTSTRVGGNMLRDITAQFAAAATELTVGTLVKTDDFTLFESVGALEIMDPKMDSGYLAPGATLEDEYDVLRTLSSEEVVGIMDQLLCCEVAWHEGYPLSQTVFSCHYIDKLLLYSDSIKTVDDIRFGRKTAITNTQFLLDDVLKPFCAALIKGCDLSLETITQSGHFYEEEDFSTHTYGRNLFQKLHENEVSALLDGAIRSVKGSTDLILRDAILDRLLLRSSLLSAMACQFNEASFRGEPTLNHWSRVQSCTDKIESTHSLGTPVLQAFSPNIQRRLASTQPPRPLVEMKFQDAISTLRNICKDCIETERIVALRPQSAEQLKILLLAFGARTPEPQPYARACLTRSVLSEGDEGFGEILKIDLRELALPADITMDPYNWTLEAPFRADSGRHTLRYEAATSLTAFTESMTTSLGGYTDIFRALLSNRCRLRRNISHIMQTFDLMEQVEAGAADAVLNKLSSTIDPIQTWTAIQKLRLMVLFVQLGFELEVYLPDELYMMYWFLHRLLTQLIDRNLAILKRQLDIRCERQNDRIDSVQRELNSARSFVASLNIWYLAECDLSAALTTLYQLLSYLGLIPQSGRPSVGEDWEDRRYELRMKPFLHLQNPKIPPHWWTQAETHPDGDFVPSPQSRTLTTERIQEYLMAIDNSINRAHELFLQYKQAGPEVAHARGAEEYWNKNASGCVTTCAGVQRSVATLQRAVAGGLLDKLTIDTKQSGEWHLQWVVPDISLSTEDAGSTP